MPPALPILLLSALVGPALGAPPVGWLGGAHLGGGYDANLAAAETLAAAQGAVTWEAGASVGGWMAPGKSRLLVGLAADLFLTPAFPDLNSGAVSGSLGLRLPVAWHLDLSLGPSVGGRWVVDPARSSLDLGGSAGLDWRARPWLRARLGYRYLHRDARDQVFDRDAHRGLVGAEIRLARHSFLLLTGSMEAGEAVFYEDVNLDVKVDKEVDVDGGAGAGAGARKDGAAGASAGSQGSPTESLGSEMIAWSIPARSTVVQVGFDQDVGRHFTLNLELGFVDVHSARSSWIDLYSSLGLRFSLP